MSAPVPSPREATASRRRRPLRAVWRAVPRLRARGRRGGAGASGLAALSELALINAAGDALITVALANTLFFDVPVGQAREKVLLYLLTTMAPFALLAPVIGPVLDRFENGRRIGLGLTMAARAILAWLMITHLTDIALFPIALGALMASRAFGVARAAVVPRVLPEQGTLVGVNARLQLLSTVGASVTGPAGLGLAAVPFLGVGWVLRLASLVFLAGVALCFLLPAHVDSDAGERTATGFSRAVATGGGRLRRALGALPRALRGVAALRVLIGFLTLYLAFVIKQEELPLAALAGLAVAVAAGAGVGVALGALARGRAPDVLVIVGVGGACASCVLATVWPVIAVALVATFGVSVSAAIAKLGLDSIVQRDVQEDVRASTFARSETALQMAWVLGGGIGLLRLPLAVAFGLAAAGMGAALFAEVAAARAARRDGSPPQPAVAASRDGSAAQPGRPAGGGSGPAEPGNHAGPRHGTVAGAPTEQRGASPAPPVTAPTRALTLTDLPTGVSEDQEDEAPRRTLHPRWSDPDGQESSPAAGTTWDDPPDPAPVSRPDLAGAEADWVPPAPPALRRRAVRRPGQPGPRRSRPRSG